MLKLTVMATELRPRMSELWASDLDCLFLESGSTEVVGLRWARLNVTVDMADGALVIEGARRSGNAVEVVSSEDKNEYVLMMMVLLPPT